MLPTWLRVPHRDAAALRQVPGGGAVGTAGPSGERNRDMVSTAAALNHDQGVATPPQVERDAPPDRRAGESPAVDAEDAVARLEADLRRSAAGAHGFDLRARGADGTQPDTEQLLAERVDLLLRDRARGDR